MFCKEDKHCAEMAKILSLLKHIPANFTEEPTFFGKAFREINKNKKILDMFY